MHPRRAAREEDQEEGKEQADGPSKDGPHADREVGVAAAAIAVDVISDDDEKGEVAGHGNERD